MKDSLPLSGPSALPPDVEVIEVDNISDPRRQFLLNVLRGSVKATVLMAFGPAVARAFSDKDSDSRGWMQRSLEHNWAYVINIDNCIGCGNCVRACRRENQVPAGFFRTWVERYVTTTDGVYIDSPDGGAQGFEQVDAELRERTLRSFTVPKMCNHCAEPPCIQVCPVGATFKAPEGFVLVDHDHCIACGYCVQSCPYGARFINPDIHKADKCTWCYHRVQNGKLPACVTVCPNKARLFGDLRDPGSEVARIFHEDKWMVLKPAMHTEPFCFYVGLHREVV